MDKALLKEAMKEVLAEERGEFWIPQPQHYKDHEMLEECRVARESWRRNHDFISSIRESAETGKRVGIMVFVSALITFIIGALVMAIKAAVRM